MRFFANDQIQTNDGTAGRVVEAYSGSHVELFDIGGSEPARVYWVLFPNGQVCRYEEDSLTAA
jgi:hypothetical protein